MFQLAPWLVLGSNFIWSCLLLFSVCFGPWERISRDSPLPWADTQGRQGPPSASLNPWRASDLQRLDFSSPYIIYKIKFNSRLKETTKTWPHNATPDSGLGVFVTKSIVGTIRTIRIGSEDQLGVRDVNFLISTVALWGNRGMFLFVMTYLGRWGSMSLYSQMVHGEKNILCTCNFFVSLRWFWNL